MDVFEFVEKRPQLACSPEFRAIARLCMFDPAASELLELIDKDHNVESMHDLCVRICGYIRETT